VFAGQDNRVLTPPPSSKGERAGRYLFLFNGHEPIYFIENKEKTLRASYDIGTQIVDYMD
jgi:hypothetical protein